MTHRLSSLIAAGCFTVLAAGCAAAVVTSPGPESPAPIVSPAATSSPPAPATPPAVPSPIASDEPDAVEFVLVDTAVNEILVDIVDAAGSVVEALSGVPGDGASVAPYEMTVVNLDPSTLRLTWSGGPCEARNTLTVDSANRRLVVVQPECPGDAVIYDRVLDLHFADPVNALDWLTMVQDGIDTDN